MQDDSQRSLPDRASAPLMDSEPFDSDGQLEALIQRVAYAPSVAPQALLAWKSPASLIGVTVAHFRIERLLGVGGLGIVYAARDLTLDRVVALKILTPPTDGDTTSRERVLHEARAAVRVNDPSVASIHEVGEDDGLAFIAMEYVEGETLQARLERGPLPWPIAVGLAVQLARGLAKAHAHGVVHRDLKPENLILGLDSKLKILDFGVAAERGTKTPEAGTPVYMAPEQARAEVADPRVDIYAFGVVLLECITGSVPLLPPPLFFVAARVQMEARGCPVALRSVIERCIEENPAARFDDGASLARAIARVARVDRARQRGWKVAASVVLALAAGICGLWIGARRRHTSIEADRVAAEEHGRLRRLTANVAERPILGSTLSPDGARLAYSDSAGLRITRIGTSEVTQVRFASGQSPQIVRWFGDGARLAVVVAVPGQDERDLRIVDIATGDFSSLGTGNFTALALSPDGRRVGYAEDDAVGWLAADKPAERHFLVRKDAGCFIGDIAWSPKGDRLAYASLCFDSLAATTLETIGLDGASPTVVMNEPRLFNDMARGGVAWLPRGDLLFSLAEWLPSEPGSNLWVLPIDEVTGKPKGERRQVTHWTGVAVSSLSIDAAGDRATFVRYDVQTDVFLGELTANKELVRPPVRLTLKERNERSPTWDKAGRGVYYSSDESGNFDLFYQDLEEGHPPVPVVATHAWETEPVLSPDGAQLLYWQIFPVDPGGATSAELMARALGADHAAANAAPTFLTRIVSHPAGVGRPPPWEARVRCASALGAACVLTKNEADDLVFYRLDPARSEGTRTLEELFRYPHPTAATRFWDVSPDGTLLAIPIANGPVRIEPLVTGERRRELVVPAGCDPGVLSWSKDQRGLFVSSECAEEPVFRLYYLPLSASPASLVWQDPPNYLLEPEPSPDGRHLAIVVKRPDDDVWLADGL